MEEQISEICIVDDERCGEDCKGDSREGYQNKVE